jgi:GT2 family glycosyltransferase
VGQISSRESRLAVSPRDKRPACLRIAPNLFVLLGLCELHRDLKDISIVVDGRAVKSPLISVPVRESDTRQLVLTLFSAALEPEMHLSWSISGELLADGMAAEAAVFEQADAGDLLGACEDRPARVDLARKLIEFILVYMKRSDDPEALAFADALVDALEPVALPDAGCVVELAPGSMLLVVTGLSDIGGVESVQVLGEGGFRRSSGRSLILSEQQTGFWMLDIPRDDLWRGSVLLWSAGQMHRIEPGHARLVDTSYLLQLCAASGPDAANAIQWLKNAVGLLGKVNRKLPGFLRELDASASASKMPVAAFPGPVSVGLTAAVRTAEGHMTVFGWIEDPHELMDQICWIGPGGTSVRLNDALVPVTHRGVPKPDTAEPDRATRRGFCATIRTPAASVALGSEVFRVSLVSGNAKTLVVGPATGDVRVARDLLLSLPADPEQSDSLFESGLAKTVSALHGTFVGGDRIERQVEIGETAASPRVSIVIPLYKNLAFLRAQYSALAMEKDSARDELIYVVDDPESASRVEAQLRAMHQLYGLACRVIVHRANFGYAPAVNSGAGLARAGHLLLLNSDVVPTTRAPVRGLLRALARRPNLGAVGPKLLFANGTIQHAGLGFDRDSRGRVFNRSLFKGYPADHRAANRSARADALTGACLLIRRDAWEAVGGLSEDYIVGDFEDTDLCLKLRAAGWLLGYEPRVSLGHYERQSIGEHQLHRTSCAAQYNRWLHQNRWFPALMPSARQIAIPKITKVTVSA